MAASSGICLVRWLSCYGSCRQFTGGACQNESQSQGAIPSPTSPLLECRDERTCLDYRVSGGYPQSAISGVPYMCRRGTCHFCRRLHHRNSSISPSPHLVWHKYGRMTPSRKHPTVAFWITVALVAVLAGYPLSFGPACWWSATSQDFGAGLVDECAPGIYWPIGWLRRNYPGRLANAIDWYATIGVEHWFCRRTRMELNGARVPINQVALIWSPSPRATRRFNGATTNSYGSHVRSDVGRKKGTEEKRGRSGRSTLFGRICDPVEAGRGVARTTRGRGPWPGGFCQRSVPNESAPPPRCGAAASSASVSTWLTHPSC